MICEADANGSSSLYRQPISGSPGTVLRNGLRVARCKLALEDALLLVILSDLCFQSQHRRRSNTAIPRRIDRWQISVPKKA